MFTCPLIPILPLNRFSNNFVCIQIHKECAIGRTDSPFLVVGSHTPSQYQPLCFCFQLYSILQDEFWKGTNKLTKHTNTPIHQFTPHQCTITTIVQRTTNSWSRTKMLPSECRKGWSWSWRWMRRSNRLSTFECACQGVTAQCCG